MAHPNSILRWGQWHRALVLLTCLLLCPAGQAPAIDWDTGFADEGRTFRDATPGGFTPPLSVRGSYAIEEQMPAAAPVPLVTANHIVLVSPGRIVTLQRIENSAGAEVFETSDIHWQYEPEEAADEGALAGRAIVPRVAAIANGMVVFPEVEGDLFGTDRFDLVGLSVANGQELWRHTVEGMERPSLARAGEDLLVRYHDPEVVTGPFGDELPGRLMRIRIGDNEPRDLIEVEEALQVPSPPFRDIVTSDGIAYLQTESGIAAYDPGSLAHLWTWPEDGSPENAGAYEGIMGMISEGGNLYFIQRDEYRVTSLDRDGNLRWSNELLPEGEECATDAWIALHPDTLVVTGVCNLTRRDDDGEIVSAGRFYGLNPETGETRWSIPVPFFHSSSPAVVSGDYFLADHTHLPAGPQAVQTRIYNVHSGGVVQQWISESGVIISPMAARDGYIFALTFEMFAGGMGEVVVFETEPANVGVEFAEPDLLPCGTPLGQPVTIPIGYSNEGPGTAVDTSIRLRAGQVEGAVEWTPPSGYETSLSEDKATMTVELGDLEPGTSGELEVEVIPMVQNGIILDVTADSGVRLTDPDNSTAGLALDVVDPAPDGLDLSIQWVEVTQGLQDRDHSIDLIAGRPTLVRVHAESNVPIPNVQAVMRLSDETNPNMQERFFGRPVEPFDNCIDLGPESHDRGDLETTINFLIPPDLLELRDQGPYQMEIELDPLDLLGETNRENSVYTRELHFDAMAPVCLVTHRVRSEAMDGGDTYGPSRIPDDHIQRGTAMLPTPEIMQVSAGNTVEKLTLSGWGPYELDPGGSTNTVRLLSTLFAHSLTTDDPQVCRTHGASVHHTGVIAEDNLSTLPGANFNGYAWMVEGVFVFRIRGNGIGGINEPAGAVTMAHEIGHTFRRFHVDCGDPSGALSNFPHHPCQLGPLGEDSFFGVDLADPLDPEVIPPRPSGADRTLGDLMSYADDRWTSDYTWDGIRGNLDLHLKHGFSQEEEQALHAWIDTNKGADETFLLVSAGIGADGSVVLEDAVQLIPDAVPEEKQLAMAAEKFRAAEEGSPWSIELAGEDGDVLLSTAVEAAAIDDTDPLEHFIGALVPMPDGVEELRIVHEDEGVKASRERPAAKPEVELLLPDSGDVIDDVLVVEWDASHPEDEFLQAMVQYSTDEGESWTTLAFEAPDEPFVFEADHLPGAVGTGLIRVVINDGFNSAEAVSEPFTVTPREPVATIHRPEDGTTFAPGEAILVRGGAYDPEDGPLMGESLVWELGGSGEVGTGSMVLLEDLPAGIYELTLTGTDSDGMTSSDAITFSVAPRQATQTEIAGVLLGVLEKAAGVIYDVTGDDAVDSADVQEAAP